MANESVTGFAGSIVKFKQRILPQLIDLFELLLVQLDRPQPHRLLKCQHEPHLVPVPFHPHYLRHRLSYLPSLQLPDRVLNVLCHYLEICHP